MPTQDIEVTVLEILSATELMSTVLSSLSMLHDISRNNARILGAFDLLQPAIGDAWKTAGMQNDEVNILRRRTATVLAKWYQGVVLDNGATWTGIESRLGRIEQRLRQREAEN